MTLGSPMVNGRPGNLPSPLSSFIGRDQESTELGSLLHSARLVTLIGLGGVGKTRLALKVAKDASPLFRHGAWMVELAGIRDCNAVPVAVAAVVGVTRQEGDWVDTLVAFLRRRQLLLLLDNCEHLLSSVAELVSRLESSCPELVVLCTSRERLGLAGERVVAVTPLGLPASRDLDAVSASDAGRLFVERAVAAKADFALAPTNAGAIADVVRQLDGIPLALELAAARVPVLSPAQLAQRLVQRFRLLADGARGATERHATMQAAIDWSYDLLSEDQQRLLTRLSVFAGGCTLEAVETVCSGRGIDQAEMLELLSGLVARSLVAVTDQVVASNLDDGERRYRLLETVRQYAEERLDPAEMKELRAHHIKFYVEFMETAALGLRGPDELVWLARVEAELENLRTALAGALATGDAVRAERLVWAAAESERGPLSAALLRDTDAVLALPGIDAIPRYSYALTASALAALFRGEWDEAEQLCDRALAATDEHNAEIGGWTSIIRAMTARMFRGSDVRTVIDHQERAWRCFCRAGKPYLIVRALNVLTSFRLAGDQTLAVDEASEALALAYRTGNPGLISSALAALAGAVADSNPERSRVLITESLELADRLGPIAVNEQALLMNTTTMARLGERRKVLARSALALDRGFSGTFRLCVCFENIAWALAPEAAHEAAVLFGHIDATVPGLAGGEPHSSLRARATDAISAQLGHSRAAELRMRGAGLGESAATEFALDAIARVLAAEPQRVPMMHYRAGTWELSFRTETATVADSKGLRDLAMLLRRPGHDIHALELIGSPLHGEATTELADRTALSQYRLRIADLECVRAEAERNNDTERIARVDDEREAILQELRSVTAVGGKARLSGARANERARKAVTARIRTAIRQLAGPMPDLAAHLDQAVMTGTWCRYSADIAERWSIDT